VASRGCSRGVFSAFSGKQDVASGSPAQDTQQLAAYWKKKAFFSENPLGFGGFQGNKLKLHTFARFDTLKGVQKF
jgi:hypothetical protein